jgi:hypothetical protein
VLRNEREVDEQTRALGLLKHYALQNGNHRMSDISRNELICRLIFLIRLLKVDTVFCYDPWGHDEENPITTFSATASKPPAGWPAAFTTIRNNSTPASSRSW